MKKKFNKSPSVKMPSEFKCCTKWDRICKRITDDLNNINKAKKIVVVEFYHGIDENEFLNEFNSRLNLEIFIDSKNAFLSEDEILKMVFPDVTDDSIFGFMTKLNLVDFFDNEKIKQLNTKIENTENGIILVTGIGASIVCENWDILIYADMARWEIQQRMRRNEVNNIGVKNKNAEFNYQYKQGYFVDWRVCDKQKKKLLSKWDYVLDSNASLNPKMISGKTYLEGLSIANSQPFSVVPFFDPGVWGGQWMKEVCDLDRSKQNYAWCFNCVPEENSLLLQFGDELFETPSINLVFYKPVQLLGEAVYSQFGDEFPIRFDFLDTMGGGNLSLQVHPLTEYIQEKFGIEYTQDESYYMMEVEEGAVVYLGTKESAIPSDVIEDLKIAEKGNTPFNADKHIASWPVKKHDHILIPAGTIHCSGKGSMVLEISATPYIFTFKLWDWGRLGMDGKPRPINIEHGEKVIDWGRTTSWTKDNLINQIEKVDEGDGWLEEKTGLHKSEFIETRRHWFTNTVFHNTNDGVNVLCLIEGDHAIVESPKKTFSPFIVNFAETFIIPAGVGMYTIRPYGSSIGEKIGTLKAFVRTNTSESFKPGLNITAKTNPLNFSYGIDCFGPDVEYRKLSDIRQSLKNYHCDGPEIVYAIAMDVGKKKHLEHLKRQHLLFGIVTYASGRLGNEPIRSQGHIHKKSIYALNWSTPEVYQIWSGKAVVYMQEYAEDHPGKCFAVYAEPGDIVVVPPSWAHATISADPNIPLTFGAWCDRDFGFEYEKVRSHNGLAWFPLLEDDGKLIWIHNPHYGKTDLIIKSPNSYSELNLKQQESIYTQYEKNPDLFSFVSKPYLKESIWNNFIP